jgi:uncharacterized protein YfdQ (DUF2303 family)
MTTTDIQVASVEGKELAIESKIINGTPIVVIPVGFQITQFDDLRDKPKRVEQTIRHNTADSFIRYYQEFATENSAIFLDTDTNTFVAIFDYHKTDKPEWCSHKAIYTLKPTSEWTAWKESDRRSMLREEFGQFIERNLEEIIDPQNEHLMDIAARLQSDARLKFNKTTHTENGQVVFQYHEEIENGKVGQVGQLKIPNTFSIGLKLFEGGEEYRINALFRYLVKDGTLLIWHELIRPHKIVEANIKDTRERIEAGMNVGSFFEALVPL